MPKISDSSNSYAQQPSPLREQSKQRRGYRPSGHGRRRNTVWVLKNGPGPKAKRLAKLRREEAEQLVAKGSAKFMKREEVKKLLALPSSK